MIKVIFTRFDQILINFSQMVIGYYLLWKRGIPFPELVTHTKKFLFCGKLQRKKQIEGTRRNPGKNFVW